jgi:pyruvate-formate lyase-activating enzyme
MSARRSEWWVALLSGLILAFLFFYNRQPYTVYALHWLGLGQPNAPRRSWEEKEEKKIAKKKKENQQAKEKRKKKEEEKVSKRR